jgi:[acyl-carrier-protein] S-malonyltransferase
MLTSASTAFVFPGQGSQFVGMGRELAHASPAARQVYAEAEAVLGADFTALCWNGPEADLNNTVNTQPALFVHSIAALCAIQERLPDLRPAFMAGHSLGEISALAAAGALSFADGLRLVRLRGEAMRAAGARALGGMAAILNLDAPALTTICAEAQELTRGVVQVANDNCPGQVVLSGEAIALEKAMELAKARGAKRAMRLPVSIAAHSPLMQSAVETFTQAVAAVSVNAPRLTVVGNVQALPLPDEAAIRAELPAQLTAPVRWTECVRYLLAQGVTTFIEVGSKDVLTGLLKRIEARATGLAVGVPDGLDKLAAL